METLIRIVIISCFWLVFQFTYVLKAEQGLLTDSTRTSRDNSLRDSLKTKKISKSDSINKSDVPLAVTKINKDITYLDDNDLYLIKKDLSFEKISINYYDSTYLFLGFTILNNLGKVSPVLGYSFGRINVHASGLLNDNLATQFSLGFKLIDISDLLFDLNMVYKTQFKGKGVLTYESYSAYDSDYYGFSGTVLGTWFFSEFGVGFREPNYKNSILLFQVGLAWRIF